MIAWQWWNHIVFSLNDTEKKWTRVKERKIKGLLLTINLSRTCQEQFENSSRLGVLNDRDPDPQIWIVQSDRFISKFILDAWLQFVYVSKTTFSSNILLIEFSFLRRILHSSFYRQGSRRCADWADRKLTNKKKEREEVNIKLKKTKNQSFCIVVSGLNTYKCTCISL